jgi:hypothetical protein
MEWTHPAYSQQLRQEHSTRVVRKSNRNGKGIKKETMPQPNKTYAETSTNLNATLSS